MYKDFYKLKELPFNTTSDPDFFFPSAHHEEAFSHLVYGIKSRRGIVVITGEIGASHCNSGRHSTKCSNARL